MKRILFVLSLFFAIPASAAEITSKITDSVQLTVQGTAVQSTRVGASYSISGSNVQFSALGLGNNSFGLGANGAYGDTTPSLTNAGQAFTFSESYTAADAIVTSQSAANGTVAAPNLYSNSTTQLGGSAGTLAGTLSNTSVPTVTAGGPGTTATGQRTIELSVFK